MKTVPQKLTILFILFPFLLSAQLGNQRMMQSKEKDIETFKIGFMTKRLNLTNEEAQLFWPIYNKYESDLEAIRVERRNNMRMSFNNKNELSDKEAEKIIDSELSFRQKEIDLMKNYNSKFKQVLPAKKVLLIYQTEEEFKRELLKRIRDRKDNRQMNQAPERME
ncbi:MAG: hypothetical protein LC117_03055 [Bacteroidia bacterium]|nr:hypothetical protein [Bacteroidia bacterium]MCZ2276892.1 hypothetical protein [Bacteroidia bacterium]